MTVIEARELRKQFTVRVKSGWLRRRTRVVTAVDCIALTVERGEMVGYIGPNGAGKSTTLKMLTGVLYPSAGQVRVCGLEPVLQRTRLARRIGVVFGQRSQLWWDLPLRDSFALLRHVYAVPATEHAGRLAHCRRLLDLDAFLDVPVRQLSLGQRMRGELTAALAFTDAREGPRTTATRRGDAFVLSGVKSFVTGGPHADLLVTIAKVTDNPGGQTGTAIFPVRRDAPGVRLVRDIRTLDGAPHGEFELAHVEVPAADVIGEIGEGVPRALESITALRLRAAATACGAARWTLDYALAQARRPHRSGMPLGEREQVQAMLGQSAMDLFAARAALYAAARAAESGEAEMDVAMAKAVATEAVAHVVDRAMQLSGGAAVVEGHPLARLYRRIRSWRIAEGTTEILRLTVARHLLVPDPAAKGDSSHASQ